MEDNIIVTYKKLGTNGEFGNQLFQIAAVVGYSLKNNYKCIFPVWKNEYSQEHYSQYFKNKIPQTEHLGDNFTTYNEPHFYYTEIPSKYAARINLFGFFQSYKYFDDVKDKIFELFEPSSLILEKINNISFDNSVCLQLRFYDGVRPLYNVNNKTPDGGSDLYFSPESNVDYFKKSINYFGKNKTYLVSSNNYVKAKKMFGKYDNFLFLEHYNDTETFFIQTLCENNIITASTFGWWGAFLNKNKNKKVFVPKNWFTKNDDYFNTKDLYPPDWSIL